MPLTARQLEVIREIDRWTSAHPYAPTLAELAGRLGIAAQTVAQHLRALRSKGLVAWEPRRPRTVRVVR